MSHNRTIKKQKSTIKKLQDEANALEWMKYQMQRLYCSSPADFIKVTNQKIQDYQKQVTEQQAEIRRQTTIIHASLLVNTVLAIYFLYKILITII